ncbi:hypothetical protein AALP_AA1G290500 [Arabis alpina]|uniref:DEAD-box ATP-dependent RNA helicase 21 n=1 Tax=Arabis alpina TaxID=50452 RepID=A0A087HRD5_ARAAL|nr:hypothetical protein AALP_AA1G290500 [Arabis alpina]
MKPVFLTKSHREEFALKRRHDEISDQHRRHNQITHSISNTVNTDRDQDLKRQRSHDRDEELAKKELIEQYLGTTKPKKRIIIKPNEKYRFSFDWEKSEDTSNRDTNIHEAQLLFGRGFRAGIDRREQRKLSSKSMNVVDKKLEDMNVRDWRIFKEDKNISYKGTKIPLPMRNWEESNLSCKLLKAVYRAGYKEPRAIQIAAIPLGVKQRDVIGIAETGSGKTAAFVLPMLDYIERLPLMSEENYMEGPYALVMVPTRELALQIEAETVKFARYLGFKVMSVIGGESIEKQALELSKGCEIVIATPGRLLDCLERRYVVLNQCNYVVLDEADRMIDMGFEPQVVGVLDAMPSSNLKPENEDGELDEKKVYRTTYMFSATMPYGVEKLAKNYLRNPVVVTVGTEGKIADTVSQQVIMIKESEKFSKLKKLLVELGDYKKAIVFVNTQIKAEFIVKNLEKLARFRVTTSHGGKSQEQRKTSLEGFRGNRFNVLVATDVLARGIDVEDIAHVINYDMPNKIEDYTHRTGRTGRAGKRGVSTTFLTLEDRDVFYDLKQMLIECKSPVPPELARHEASKFKPGTFRAHS